MDRIPPPDRHHAIHPRRDYTTGIFATLRRQHLLIPKILFDSHHEIYPYSVHANVPPPPKPSEYLARIAIDYLKPFEGRINHLEAIERLAYRLDPVNDLGSAIAQNLMDQLVYIGAGYVEA